MRTSRSQGFTLIELLVVIGIIALLAAILLPVVQGVFKRADVLKAKNEVSELRKAVESYFNTYGKLPYRTKPSDQKTRVSGTQSQDIVKTLTALDNVTNPREKIFLELKTIFKDGTMKDPWGTQYAMYFDVDLNGTMDTLQADGTWSTTTSTATRSIVVSAGPNAVFGDADDITTLSK